MIIGIPKETKVQEYRVGCTPAGVREFNKHGHKVFFEKDCGIGSGFTNEEYSDAGGIMVDTAKEVWESSKMIIKVKEPIPAEYKLLQKEQILYTYLHLAANSELTEVLLEKEVTAVAYETFIDDHGGLPLLEPMSEIAGKIGFSNTRFVKARLQDLALDLDRVQSWLDDNPIGHVERLTAWEAECDRLRTDDPLIPDNSVG